ncbi:phosphoribosyltransferase [Cronbergia sp. UHCC 0137]|uniref:phosphoribosyltransferase n=1 Tax=Cronbergia sp. UHCC 0137 TaxID=3110239 RepID=UPI002B1F2DA1|nr:phosphoribosyltransferase [Cronbergia sp. UHCC 0137]MEA5617168.1 phosphoribosyltransferase [Cronbergia sp. UHCC 0137]
MLFKDRQEAGQLLAEKLKPYADRPDVTVLALPRGGVPVAFEVAKALKAPLDVLVVRKLGVPNHAELAMGAIAPGGVRILNQQIVQEEHITDDAIARIAIQEERELERREYLYRQNRPFPQLRGQTVILIDDGLATGATMWAAVVAVRQQQPAHIIIGVPVASPETCQQLAAAVDEIICIHQPKSFYSVGLWYEDFPQTSDRQVQDLLHQIEPVIVH